MIYIKNSEKSIENGKSGLRVLTPRLPLTHFVRLLLGSEMGLQAAHFSRLLQKLLNLPLDERKG
jgi:hypothetical protein